MLRVSFQRYLCEEESFLPELVKPRMLVKPALE